jgi:hypothetical protein
MGRTLIVAVIASVSGCKAASDAPAVHAFASDDDEAPTSSEPPGVSGNTVTVTGDGNDVTVNGRRVAPVSTSGGVRSEKRTVPDFSAIEVTGAFRVEAGAGPVAVEVDGDASVVPLVVTEVTNGTLHIHMRNSVTVATSLPVIKLSAPTLRAVTVTGAGHTAITGVHGATFAAKTDGAAILTLEGSADRLELSATGGGEVKALRLTVDAAKVDATGAVEVDVAAAKSLEVHASGACRVRYHGNPSVVQDALGASSITQI